MYVTGVRKDRQRQKNVKIPLKLESCKRGWGKKGGEGRAKGGEGGGGNVEAACIRFFHRRNILRFGIILQIQREEKRKDSP